MGLPVCDHDRRLLLAGEYRGFKYEVLHNDMGFRCGYVCIPKGHPWFGVMCNDIPCDVHGGLTFGSTPRIEEFTALGITVPAREARSTIDGNEYWIGFDCGHAFDSSDDALFFLANTPAVVRESFQQLAKYGKIRPTRYVEEQCKLVIEQAILATLNTQEIAINGNGNETLR
jgi:hypothetical protein